MKINIPKSLEDLKIKHLELFNYITGLDLENIGIENKIKIISLYSGVKEDRLKMVNLESLNKLHSKIAKIIGSYKPQEIPLSITYNNKEYTLRDSFNKLPTGWFIDVSVSDLAKEPEKMIAFCYIEKGMDYAQQDKHKNILNPLSERANVFKDNMPLPLYMSIAGFFLTKYNQYSEASRQIQKARRNLSLSNGKK